MGLGCAQCPPTRMLSASTMTAQRQERNGSRPEIRVRPGIALIGLLAISVGWIGPGRISLSWIGLGALGPAEFAAQASTTERVVVNRFSGLAIEGYDPVAYFVDARPTIGLPEFEASQAGAVWRFHNEGNRASFVAHPDIYGPQFGGYDPLDLARGKPRCLCRRSGACAAGGEYALAGAGAGTGPVEHERAILKRAILMAP